MIMGTRGTYGFYKNGVSKLTYNHFDSYPENLGADIVKFVRSCTIEELNQIFDSIVMIDERSMPTLMQIKECEQWYDASVSNQTRTDWYCLLRNAQGDIFALKQGLKYMLNHKDFIKESLFCEWGYIINLDTNELEIYKGYQRRPNNNRYACKADEDGYYNCALIRSYPLDEISENWIKEVSEAAA
jgi:hypothetical protein